MSLPSPVTNEPLDVAVIVILSLPSFDAITWSAAPFTVNSSLPLPVVIEVTPVVRPERFIIPEELIALNDAPVTTPVNVRSSSPVATIACRAPTVMVEPDTFAIEASMVSVPVDVAPSFASRAPTVIVPTALDAPLSSPATTVTFPLAVAEKSKFIPVV